MSDLSQFLYRIQPTRPAMLTEGPTPAEQQAVAAHFAYLQQLLQEGALLLAGRTQNSDYSSFGIIIFLAASEEEAQAIVANDPAVQQRVMRAELYPYRIALAHASLLADT